MLVTLRTITVAAALLLAAPLATRAESAPAQPAAAAAPCPHAEDGTCCGTCQDKDKAAAAHAEPGGCPCQRAKEAKAQKAADEAAKAKSE